MASIHNYSDVHSENVHIDYIRYIYNSNGDYLDITDIVDILIIEEDIEGGFIKGEMTFLDDMFRSTDVYSGDELIDVSFSSVDHAFKIVDKPYSKKFRIHKVEKVKNTRTGKFDGIIMKFSDNAPILNDSIKLNRTYVNTSSSQFINECCDLLKYEGSRLIEETLHGKHFTAPNVSPLDMVNWIKSTSQSKETNGSDFYFFENMDGINFKSLDSMISVIPDADHTLYYRPNSDGYTYNSILAMETPKVFDVKDDIRHGGIGATVFTHDMVNKSYNKYNFDINKLPRLNPVNPRGSDYESSNDAFVQFWSANQSYAQMSVNSNTHSALIRSMQRTRMNYSTIQIQIPGTIVIKSGDIVDIKMPSNDGNYKVDESGKWLVKKLKHILTQGSFYTQLELVTDGNIA